MIGQVENAKIDLKNINIKLYHVIKMHMIKRVV